MDIKVQDSSGLIHWSGDTINQCTYVKVRASWDAQLRQHLEKIAKCLL